MFFVSLSLSLHILPLMSKYFMGATKDRNLGEWFSIQKKNCKKKKEKKNYIDRIRVFQSIRITKSSSRGLHFPLKMSL